jgi:hypothetical protein
LEFLLEVLLPFSFFDLQEGDGRKKPGKILEDPKNVLLIMGALSANIIPFKMWGTVRFS